MEDQFNPFVRFASRVTYEHMTEQIRVASDSRIFFFHGGRGNLTVHGRVFSLLPGVLVYIPANTPYRFTDTAKVQMTAINFDFTQRRRERRAPFSSAGQEAAEEVADILPPELCAPLLVNDWIAAGRVMLQLTNLLTEAPPYHQEIASATLKLFLIDLIRNSSTATESTAESVMTYLRRHCCEPLSNTELAHRLGYHPVHLNRLVKGATGMGCRAYIISCRLSEAKQLLVSTDATVTEIAERCGFASASHFARLMKKVEGKSPLAFRHEVMHNIV